MQTLYQNPLRFNLLPHREAMKEERKKQFATRALLVAVLAGVLMLLAWQLIDRYVVAQQDRNQFLSAEIKKLDQEIAQINTLQQEIEALKARQKAVEDLQADRNLPVYVFEELSSYIPAGVFLKSIRQDAKRITLTGLAQTQERVSEMLRNFTNASVWLEKPELLETKLASNNGGIKTSEKLFEFSIAVIAKREKKDTTANSPGNLNAAGKPQSQATPAGTSPSPSPAGLPPVTKPTTPSKP